MKQFYWLRMKELFPGSETMRKYSFKTMTEPRDKSALLAVVNRQTARVYSVSRVKSAHFSIEDCFECLLPHKIPAA